MWSIKIVNTKLGILLHKNDHVKRKFWFFLKFSNAELTKRILSKIGLIFLKMILLYEYWEQLLLLIFFDNFWFGIPIFCKKGPNFCQVGIPPFQKTYKPSLHLVFFRQKPNHPDYFYPMLILHNRSHASKNPAYLGIIFFLQGDKKHVVTRFKSGPKHDSPLVRSRTLKTI